MLSFNPDHRPTISEVLSHPFLKGLKLGAQPKRNRKALQVESFSDSSSGYDIPASHSKKPIIIKRSELNDFDLPPLSSEPLNMSPAKYLSVRKSSNKPPPPDSRKPSVSSEEGKIQIAAPKKSLLSFLPGMSIFKMNKNAKLLERKQSKP